MKAVKSRENIEKPFDVEAFAKTAQQQLQASLTSFSIQLMSAQQQHLEYLSQQLLKPQQAVLENDTQDIVKQALLAKEQAYEELLKTHQQLTLELEQSAQNSSKHEQELNKLQTAYDDIIAQLSETTATLSSLKQAYAEQEAENDRLQKLLSEFEQDKTKASETTHKLEHALAVITELQNQLKNAERENVAAENMKQHLENQLRQGKFELQALADEQELAQAQFKAEKEQITNLLKTREDELAKQAIELDNVKALLAEEKNLQKDNAALVARFQQEVIDRKKTYDLQQQKIQQLQHEMDEKLLQQQLIQQQLSDVSDEKARLESALLSANAAKDELTKLQEQSETKLSKVEAQLEHAQNRQAAIEQKQIQEADTSRELIKNLRLELAQQQDEFKLQLQAVEERMMEFKLKFEYAQKQLKTSN